MTNNLEQVAPDLLHACVKAEQKIKQLCDMVNTYSNKLGLGDKVRLEHWLDETSAAIAKATAARAVIEQSEPKRYPLVEGEEGYGLYKYLQEQV